MAVNNEKMQDSWPQKDDQGYYQSYQQNSRWCNWWAKDKPGISGFIRRWRTFKDESSIPSQSELDKTLPVVKPYWLKDKTSAVGKAGIRATWLGHACVLAEIDKTVVITDPIFSERASAVQWAGPKRYRPPACSVEQLPDNLDAVVISHNHYDHLDYGSVKAIHKRYQDNIHWFVPEGIGSWLRDNLECKHENIHELVWWEEASLPGSKTKFVLTPSNHWCRRSALDSCKALWGSWAVIGEKHCFWFGGDTAYCDVFSQIQRKYGQFHLSAIPIGAYNPQWFMKWVHVNPPEAVQIHKDLNSLKSFGIHWGTFKLTYEHYLEPREGTISAARDQGLADDEFEVVNIGCTVQGKMHSE